MRIKMKRFLGILLSLALVLGLMPGMSMTAYAATLDNVSTTWSENSDIVDNVTINNNVTVDADITLTIPAGKTLTINGQSDYDSIAVINDNSHTLTVSGGGTLIVNAPAEEEGHPRVPGIDGNLIVDGATVQVTGGADGVYGDVTVKSGSVCVNGGNGKAGGNGYSGISGVVIVNGGSITVVGGNGGNGDTDSTGAGGSGGYGVGDVIVNGGSATITGGNGGTKSNDNASNGSFGQAVTGSIIGNAKESEDNINWTSVTGSFSQKQYIKFVPILVTGVSLDKTTAQTIDVDGKVFFTATVTPENASDKTVKWSVGGTNADAVTLYSDEACETPVTLDTATETLTVYAKGISAGSATVTCTSNADSTKSASCEVTVNAGNTTFNPASTYTGFGGLNTNNTELTISEVSGITWYVIANDSSTVTLLSKQSFGSQQFNSDTAMGNDYETSEIKTYVEGLTGEGQPLAGISSVISDLTLIDTTTAQGLSETKRKGAGATWWLRSPSTDIMVNYYAAFVNGATGEVFAYGGGVTSGGGVRPALKLDLSKVTFDSATNTFALLPTLYPLWVCGVQVTSANKDDVLGDVDQGETVIFTPAVDDDAATTDVDESRPATLTLNGATISGGSSESKNAAIYAIGELTINVTGDNTVTGPVNQTGDSYGIRVDDNSQSSVNVSLNITGSGTLTSTGGSNSEYSYGIMTWNIYPGIGDITIGAETTVNAVGQGSSNGYGIYSRGKVNVNGSLTATGVDAGVSAHNGGVNVSKNAKLTATGREAIGGTVKNAIAGTGWTDTEGTTGKDSINVSETGQSLNSYKKVQFPAVHEHSFTYEANGATITATCANTDGNCTLPESSAGAGDHVATLTISANGGTYDGTTAYGATITDANSIQGDAKVQYQKKTNGSYGTATETVPTDAGDYKASITVGGATASVEYTIKTAQETTTKPTDTTPKDESSTVYRLYYGPTMEHFYTTSAYERRVLIDKYGWIDEGIAWKSPKAPTTDEEKKTIKPVYRLFNPFTTDHHYTKDANERKTLIDKYGWKDEGIAFYSNDKGDATVYRLWHPGLITGAHHFTTGKHEYDVLITRGWIGETEAFKVNAAS